jgi:HTH-type transcriptional regulator/antitoxin MqsA
MTCNVCGNESFHPAAVSETFKENSGLVVVENIPASVCDRCGETNFSAEVAEAVRRLVNGPHQATRVIQAEVLEYRAA